MLHGIRRLFSRSSVIQDPVIGPLKATRAGRLWVRTEPLLLGRDSVEVHVHAREEGPSERQRRLLSELFERFDELQSEIGLKLYDEYRSLRQVYQCGEAGSGDDFEKDFPSLEKASDIWRIAHLSVVTLQGYGGVDVTLRYEIDWGDPDHCLCVMIKDGKVVAVGKEG